MHHGRAAIHNDPLAVFLAFDPWFGIPGGAHGVAHTGSQSPRLPVGRARRHDDAFEQRREVFGIEHLNVLRLDVFQTVHDGTLQFLDGFFFGC